MKRPIVILASLCLLPLYGCISSEESGRLAKNRENLYQFAELEPPLVVSENLDFRAADDLMPVPAEVGMQRPEGQGVPKRISLAAPKALLVPEMLDQIRIQSLGERSWLVAPKNPAAVWPKLVLFITDHRLGTRHTDPATGLLETAWFSVEPEAEDAVRQALLPINDGDIYHRIVFNVEQAVKDDFTEVHIQVFNTSDASKAVAAAGAQNEGDAPSGQQAVPAKNTAVLKVLAAALLASDQRKSVSLMATTIGSIEAKAHLLWDAQGQPSLRLSLDNNRFLATVRRSLDNAGIPVHASDDELIEITFDRMLVRDRLEKDTLKWLRGHKAGRLELHLRWENEYGYIAVLQQDAAALDADYAEQVLLFIREHAL